MTQIVAHVAKLDGTQLCSGAAEVQMFGSSMAIALCFLRRSSNG